MMSVSTVIWRLAPSVSVFCANSLHPLHVNVTQSSLCDLVCYYCETETPLWLNRSAAPVLRCLGQAQRIKEQETKAR